MDMARLIPEQEVLYIKVFNAEPNITLERAYYFLLILALLLVAAILYALYPRIKRRLTIWLEGVRHGS